MQICVDRSQIVTITALPFLSGNGFFAFLSLAGNWNTDSEAKRPQFEPISTTNPVWDPTQALEGSLLHFLTETVLAPTSLVCSGR